MSSSYFSVKKKKLTIEQNFNLFTSNPNNKSLSTFFITVLALKKLSQMIAELHNVVIVCFILFKVQGYNF